jgi:hypothetical protein
MTLLKNGDSHTAEEQSDLSSAGGPLPFKPGNGKTIAVIGQAVNNTGMLTGNYDGPLCPKGGSSCWPTVYEWIDKM